MTIAAAKEDFIASAWRILAERPESIDVRDVEAIFPGPRGHVDFFRYHSVMENPQQNSLLISIARIAAEAGMPSRIEKSTGLLAFSVEIDDGRRQMVYARQSTCLLKSRDDLATIFSPCCVLSSEELSNATFLRSLLVKSGELPLGRFAIVPTKEEEKLLVLMCDQIVGTMEKEEILAVVEILASEADDFERTRGRDDY